MTEDMPRARSRSPSKSPAPFSTSTSTPELQRKSSTSSLHSLHRQTSSSDLHRPPSAADLKPNAHPYPIATTATALLSRANSLSSPSPNQTRHHYVPSSPSASGEFRDGRDGDREKGVDKMDKETREKSERRRAEYRGHRYSRSLSSSEDMYLPSASPSASAKGKDKTANGEYSGAPSGPRALPVPPGVSANSIAARSAAAAGSYSSYAASGISPKRWTPAQLAAHLARTVSAEAGAWAAQKNVGGRAFIRMGMDGMGEGEGELGGAPPALRPAARALRQEVLQNQLASSPISSSDDEGGNGNFFGGRNASPTRMGSVSPSRPRVSDVEEETEEPGEGEDEGTPSHRRRTMSVPVASPFTSTSTSTSTSPFAPRSSPFASRSNYANDGRESRSAESPSPTGGRFRNGRVRGMVRTFESSGSESGGEGSPERERERGGSGSGFRAANGNGSGFRAANGSGFRANGNGSGFRNATGASEEGDEDAIGGTVKPRALPVRPDGLGSLGDADVDLGATVRAWDHAYPNGKANANAGYGNGTFVPAANGTSFGHAANASGDEEELTVEELIAREDALLGGGGPQVQPNYTGGGGAWRTGRRGAGLEAQLTGGRLESGEYLTQQRTGGSSDSLMQQRTGGGGGRPLPAHPPSSSSSSSHPAHGMNRSGSGGVHAWEAEDGAVGATVKRVAASPAPSVSQAQGVKRVFGGAEADVDDLARNRPTEAEARREQAKAEADAQERGRARGAAVRAQLAEAADLRALVDKFRVRLEEVERRVGEMEVAATTTSSAPTAGTQKEQETPPPTPTQLTVSQRLDPRRLLALFASAPAAAQRTNGANANANAKREEWVGPTTLGALPSYVLLVGLGMCAVVLRVLVKRGLGAVRGRGAA